MSKLLRAIEAGKLDKVKQILANDKSIDLINHVNQKGITPLICAINNHEIEIIEYFLNDEIISTVLDINAGNNNNSAIFSAINTNNELLAIQLVNKGCNPNTKTPNECYIIHAALNKNYLKLAETLFKQNDFKFKVKTKDKENIIHLIIDYSNPEFLQCMYIIFPFNIHF